MYSIRVESKFDQFNELVGFLKVAVMESRNPSIVELIQEEIETVLSQIRQMNEGL